RIFLAVCLMTPSPSVTWPSPAMTTAPVRRTQRTVVERIRRLVGMSAILDYNSADHVATAALGCPVRAKLDRFSLRPQCGGRKRGASLRRTAEGGCPHVISFTAVQSRARPAAQQRCRPFSSG